MPSHRRPEPAFAARIQSESNQHVKRARSLLRRKSRYQERAFIVEGVRSVRDALEWGVSPDVILASEDGLRRLGSGHMPTIRMVDDAILASLSSVEHSQGVLGIFPMQGPETGTIPVVEFDAFWVVSDGVRDPGNLGTLLRSAAAAGASGMMLSGDSVDPYNPKCVRAAMGAHFRVPIHELDGPDLTTLLGAFETVALADAAGTTNYTSAEWHGAVALVIGGEARGASEEVKRMATATVYIPLENGVESLNAGVAGSLLMFEVARGRRPSR